MRERSSDSVKTRFLDGPRAVEALRAQARALLSSDQRVRKIVLFGSLARGDYSARSDADLLIVLHRDERRFMDRIPEFLRAFLSAPLPVEVFPHTEEELERMEKQGNHWLKRVMKEGITLAERQEEGGKPLSR